MIQTRSYHGMQFNIRISNSNKIAYLILPSYVVDDMKKWMNKAAEHFNCSIVCIWGVDWDNDLTPWITEGINKKDSPFRGHSAFFLKNFIKDHIRSIETEHKLVNPERTLVGVSLSGLFAIWSAFNTDAFTNIISLSGSLWYEGLVSWIKSNKLNPSVKKIYLALGDKERKVKEPRFAIVQDATEEIVSCLEKELNAVKYVLEHNTTHLSPLPPRLDDAFEYIFASGEVNGDGDTD